MLMIKIFLICLIIFVLWYIQILYKNKWNEEFEENMDYRDKVHKWSTNILSEQSKLLDNYLELKIKNENITRELLNRDKKYNELLNNYNKLKNNRVAKVISEEKIERVEGTK